MSWVRADMQATATPLQFDDIDTGKTLFALTMGGAASVEAGALLLAQMLDEAANAPLSALATVQTRSVGAAEGGMTPLFRAVNPAELSDIGANAGAFRNLGSAEGKYFSTTAEGAASYARQTFGTALYEGPYTIVQTAIPSSSVTPLMGATVDRGISTIVVPNNLLPTLTPGRGLPFTPLPRP